MPDNKEHAAAHYANIDKALHWITAFIVAGLLSVGFYMTSLSFGPLKLQIYGLHKSFGILVWMIALLRVLRQFTIRKPKPLHTHTAWEKYLSKIVHACLYACLILMPLSGWIMSSAGDFPAPFFGLFDLPHIVNKNEAIFELSRDLHSASAIILVVLVTMHAAGAFKHHFIDKDTTLIRMTRPNLSYTGGLIIALIAAFLMAPPLFYGIEKTYSLIHTDLSQKPSKAVSHDIVAQPLSLKNWTINHDKSHIKFKVKQDGSHFTGQFRAFDGDIAFDPSNLSESRVDISIDIHSITTGSTDRDTQAQSSEWFDATVFPKAQFTAHEFEHIDENLYTATGTLKIRGVSNSIVLPFSLDIIDGFHAIMRSTINLKRLDFGIGQKQWSNTDTIGNLVTVNIVIDASRTDQDKPLTHTR